MTGQDAAEKAAGKVAALAALSRDDLAERWAAIYGCPAPPGARRDLLIYAAAWHCQAKLLGGMSADTRKLLKRAVAGVERVATGAIHAASDANSADGTNVVASGSPGVSSPADTPERRTLVPGARLIRDWNGRTHVVDVVEGGFLFEGKLHSSLSAIAKLITGAHWSGPRFFGL